MVYLYELYEQSCWQGWLSRRRRRQRQRGRRGVRGGRGRRRWRRWPAEPQWQSAWFKFKSKFLIWKRRPKSVEHFFRSPLKRWQSRWRSFSISLGENNISIGSLYYKLIIWTHFWRQNLKYQFGLKNAIKFLIPFSQVPAQFERGRLHVSTDSCFSREVVWEDFGQNQVGK